MLVVCTSAEVVPDHDLNLIKSQNLRKHFCKGHHGVNIKTDQCVGVPEKETGCLTSKYKSVIKVVKGGPPSKQLASVELHISLRYHC